jgi:hypothetical protein
MQKAHSAMLWAFCFFAFCFPEEGWRRNAVSQRRLPRRGERPMTSRARSACSGAENPAASIAGLSPLNCGLFFQRSEGRHAFVPRMQHLLGDVAPLRLVACGTNLRS